MTRLPRSRAALTVAAALGAGAVGLVIAPAASAASFTAPSVPATVTAGTPFTVTGTGCFVIPSNLPIVVGDDYVPGVYLATDLTTNDDDLVAVDARKDGTWSAELTFPAGTTGTHEVDVACANGYHEDPVAYPTVKVTVQAAAAPAGAAAEWKPGQTPNTPGIANQASAKTTGNAAAPGQKVVKVLKGFKRFEKVTLVLHSTPVTLGTFTADANGVVTAEFTIPAGTPLGQHTLAYDGDQGSHFEDPLTLTKDGKALAYTGADIKLPLIGGTVLLAAGAGALVVGRRRRTTGAAQA